MNTEYYKILFNRFFILGFACLSIHCLLLSARAREASKPNIIFIMADDLGWGDVGFHNGLVPTPNLARIANASLEMKRHYVAPVCSPTRTGLMTGRCWSRFGVTSPQNEQALPFGTLTIATVLKTQGYQTWITGKWHLGSRPETGPLKFGFEKSYGSLAGGVSPWNHFYKKGPFERTWHRNDILVDEPGHVTDLITNEALKLIDNRDTSRPFFLYIPFTAVHLPVKEPQHWVDQVPLNIKGDVARHYAASIMHLDDAIGQVIRKLENLHLRENTLLVFTSDNGGSTAENDDRSYPDDNCPRGPLPGNNKPWRGKKGDLYEGGTRVPTIVSWPGKIQAGMTNAPAQITDWLPTFAELAGYPAAKADNWDGMSLLPLLFENKAVPDRPIYAVAPGWKSRSLHYGKWKLIQFETNGSHQKTELYDVETDLGEINNLEGAKPDIRQMMQQKMKKMAVHDNDSVVRRRPLTEQNR